jgi:hypothetical protein
MSPAAKPPATTRPAALSLALLLALGLAGHGLAGPALARGGGGGAGHGGSRGLHGAYHFGERGTGYDGHHPAYGPGARPGWDGGRGGFYDRGYNGWHAGWAHGGYWGARPWRAGWYGVGGPGWGGWGWWGANAAAWGVAGLATGAAITSLVNAAADAQATTILVPETTYTLNYASVEAVGTYGVSFNYSLPGGDELMGAVNCQQGLLNGQIPQTVKQAQLLNAVCAVAYGGGS